MNKRLMSAFTGLFLIILGVVGLSYAIFTFSGGGTTDNIITSGTLKMTLDEKEGVSLLNAYPVTDAEGVATDYPYRFVLKNTGTLALDYQIYLVDDTKEIENDKCSGNLLEKDYVKLSLKKDGVSNASRILANNNVLDSGTLNADASISYELRLWVSDAANLPDIAKKHYHSKLEIKSKQTNATEYK